MADELKELLPQKFFHLGFKEKELEKILELAKGNLIVDSIRYSEPSDEPGHPDKVHFMHKYYGNEREGQAIILPVDAHGHDFVLGSSKNIKFISIPDLLYFEPFADRMVVYPLDIKSKSEYFITPAQLSEFNLAELFKRSTFLSSFIAKLKDDYSKNLMLSPGGIVSDSNESPGLAKIAAQIMGYLSDSGIEGSLHIMEGTPFLTHTSRKTSFEHDYDGIHIEQITQNQMYGEISSVKNFVKTRGYYPCRVIAVSSFDRSGNPLLLFNYLPNMEVQTFDPGISLLKEKRKDLEEFSLDAIKSLSDQVRDMVVNDFRETLEEQIFRIGNSIIRDETEIRKLEEYMLQPSKSERRMKKLPKKYEEYKALREKISEDLIEIKKLKQELYDKYVELTTKKWSFSMYSKTGFAKIKRLSETHIKNLTHEIDFRENKLLERNRVDLKLLSKMRNWNDSNRFYMDGAIGTFYTPSITYLSFNKENTLKIISYSRL